MATSIQLKNNLPVILIDTSYFIFYRYYSTLKWYQFRNKEINYQAIDQDDTFMTAFYKHIQEDFKKLAKTWKTDFSQFVFCCDCSRDKIWRNEFTEQYKQTRIVNPTFNGQIFLRFYQFLEERTQNILTLDHLEADDICYLSKTHLQTNNFPQPIVIITNDNDYLQLLDPTTHIYNMNPKKNNLAERSCGDPRLDLRIKLIMGDKVDNIKPIHPGIGPKSAARLASLDEPAFEQYLQQKNCKHIFLNNKKLIDFTEIPQPLQQAFKEKYQFEFV